MAPELVAPYAATFASALQDSEMLVRRDAAKVLAGIDDLQTLKPHADLLTECLEDEFWPVRLWACKGMAILGSAAAKGVCARKLATLSMEDAEPPVREMAAMALGCLGH